MPRTKTRAPAVGGQAGGATNDAAPAPGSMFGIPKFGTQPRLVPDNQNESVAATPNGGSQIPVGTTRLDQLDIVKGIKIPFQYAGTWTIGSGKTLTTSPFFPASIIQQITFKLQAAYNSFNLTGPLAAIHQAFRPMWGDRGVGTVQPDVFADFNPALRSATGVASPVVGTIDIPLTMKFDEYFDLAADGTPTRRLYDALVTPMFMAAQARVVVPTINLAPQMAVDDLLGSPVSKASGDTTSTFTAASFAAGLYRDAFWTASNPAANPPQYPWLYTNDFFTQPTSGQNKVNCLIQNTGVSVGQVLSLYGFVWDPEAAAGLGGVVEFADIESFELVLGGSLQNRLVSPQLLTDQMRSKYGEVVAAQFASNGVFVFDFALSDCGSYVSNADAINTYLINGVSLNITFVSGSIPSSASTVYMGVEALKLATS